MKLAVTYLKYCATGVIGRRSALVPAQLTFDRDAVKYSSLTATKINAMLTPIEE